VYPFFKIILIKIITLFSVIDSLLNKGLFFSKKTSKGKAIRLQAWTGPKGSRRLSLSDFKTIGTKRW